MGFSSLAKLLVLSTLASCSAASMEPIVVKGSKFFYKNGTQFFIKGVAYQQGVDAAGATPSDAGYTDPLSDEKLCARDIPLLQKLGTNVIRTYAIDPTKDHSKCMALLQSAGIYVISDLSQPAESIERDSPRWNTELYARYTSVVDELVKYDNVIGFFAGNEVTNKKNNTAASAYVKAAVRDVKAYLKTKGTRWFGVGYAANDDADIRADLFQYMNCGNQDSAIDYLGFNIYEWCGQNTFENSGYANRTNFFRNYSVPVFFAEYGCNQGGAEARLWQDTSALYSSQMTDVWSGGIAYMYFEETNDYGLVTIDNNQAKTMTNYGVLSSRLAAATPSGVASDEYTPTNSPQPCPATHSAWVATNDLPPTPNATVCGCMFSGLGCVPAPKLATKDYGKLFGTVCGLQGVSCDAISSGPYSMCNDTEKLGYVLNEYYTQQKSDSKACSFDGQAVTTAASTGAVCAGVTTPTPTSTSTPSSSKNFAAPVPMRGALSWGEITVGVYVVFAMLVGTGLVML